MMGALTIQALTIQALIIEAMTMEPMAIGAMTCQAMTFPAMTFEGMVSFGLRRGLMVAAALAAHLLVGWFVWKAAPRASRKRIKPWLWALFAVVNMPFLLILIDWAASLHLPPGFYRGVVVPFVVWQLAVLVAAVFLALGIAVSFVAGKLRSPVDGAEKRDEDKDTSGPADATRRKAILGMTAAVGAGAVALASKGAGLGAGDPVITRPQAEIDGLDDALVGFKIAQLTDIHAGYFYDEDRLRRLSRIVNRLRPDLIVLTGDQMHGFHPAFVPEMASGLSSLSAPAGVVAVLGNHDHRAGRKRVIDAMRSVGWTVLWDESTVLPWRGAELNVAGIKDWSDHPDMGRALAGLRRDRPTLLLSHRPRVFPEAARRGVDLVLAGHTHGGQVRLAGVNVAGSVYEYLHGMYRREKTSMYVCAGVGVTGPPLRLGVPPELALVELRRAKKTSERT